MTTIAGKWAGRIYGTNTGNLFLELDQDQDRVSGTARFLDDKFGLVIYEIEGESKEQIRFNLTPKKYPEGIKIGAATAIAQLRHDGSLIGDWKSDIGTAGTFQAFPHIYDQGPAKTSGQLSIPEQIYNRTISVGSIRLYELDVNNLFEIIRRDFVQGRLIVTYKLRDSDVTKYSEDFFKDSKEINKLPSLKMSIQEPEAYGINKMVVVDLTERSGSEIRVAGINESWVVGKAESLAKALSSYQNRLVTRYRKYGLNLNTVIFLLMLVAIPEIFGWLNRLIFVGSVVVLLIVLLAIHSKLIPNTLVFLSKPKTGVLGRIWPSVVSWLIAVTSALVATWIFSKLTQSP